MVRYFVVVPLLLWMAAAKATPGEDTKHPERLLVGVKEAPPFVIRHADGRWSGISIELWRAVAEKLGVDYRFQAFELPELLSAVKRQDVDIAVGALTITEEREEFADFTHTFYVSSLGIAVPAASSQCVRPELCGRRGCHLADATENYPIEATEPGQSSHPSGGGRMPGCAHDPLASVRIHAVAPAPLAGCKQSIAETPRLFFDQLER